MKLLRALPILLCMVASTAYADIAETDIKPHQDSNVQIIEPSDWYVWTEQSAIEQILKRNWLGLYKNSDGYSLKKVTPATKTKENAHTGEPGKVILAETSDDNKLVIMLSGIHLQQGKLNTAKVTIKGSEKQAKYNTIRPYAMHKISEGFIDLELNNEKYQLSFIQEDSEYNTCVLKLTKGNKAQLLGMQKDVSDANSSIAPLNCYDDEYDHPELLWAGDLDNDNKLDLLFGQINGNETCYSNILFLSSNAKGDNLVGAYNSFSLCGD